MWSIRTSLSCWFNYMLKKRVFYVMCLQISIHYVIKSFNPLHVVTTTPTRHCLELFIAVALRQTRLVLGWVTVCGRVNHFGM